MDGANASPMTVGGGPNGRYELLGRLAVGGMAELFLARPMDSAPHDGPSVVVLKRILPHLAEDPEFVRMFRDEAVLAAKLEHPNIVRVRDIGLDGETHFFTMEYVHGETLRAILKAAQARGHHIPLAHVLAIGLGVTAALHHAHEQVDERGEHLRIVHRDVSPTNVLVARDGGVKLVDFGIAKAAAATHVTQAGMLKGKASYMSPEQCRADPVDRRSDVFSMGILLFEMSTLTRLFRGDNELVILNQVLTGAVTRPSERREDVPPELERIVLRALQTQPDARYQTALEMHRDLELFARSHDIVPSATELARYVEELLGPKPLPWARPSAGATPRASESGIATQVDPLGDDTQTTTQRDRTPARAPVRPPPRGRARKPSGKHRATAGESGRASDRSPATPGRRTAWTGRRPNADPATRPPGAPRPGPKTAAHARVEAVPAPGPKPKPGRATVAARARVDPVPRPARPDASGPGPPGTVPSPRPPRSPSGPHPTPSAAPRKRSRNPSSARPGPRFEPTGPPPRGDARSRTADMAAGSGREPRSPRPSTTQAPPSTPNAPADRTERPRPTPTQRPAPPADAAPRVDRQTGPRRAAPRAQPPGVRTPSSVDRTQLGPRPSAAKGFSPPFVPQMQASVDPRELAPAASGTGTLPPSAPSSSSYDAVDRTMVTSDDYAPLQGAAFPVDSASNLTGHTQPMRPSDVDISEEELRIVRGSRVGLIVTLVVAISVALGLGAWVMWPTPEPSENAPAAGPDDRAEPERAPAPDPDPEPPRPEAREAAPLEPTPADAEGDTEAVRSETPEAVDEAELPETDPPSAETDEAPPSTASDHAQRPRRPRKPASEETKRDEVPALPGFGPGPLPP